MGGTRKAAWANSELSELSISVEKVKTVTAKEFKMKVKELKKELGELTKEKVNLEKKLDDAETSLEYSRD